MSLGFEEFDVLGSEFVGVHKHRLGKRGTLVKTADAVL
jgi:hypothetical protein